MEWAKLLYVVMAIFLGWMMYRYVRANPQAFSSANLGKSFYTLGILAVLLIAFIAFCVFLLRA